jgi:hypothetical protein
MQQAITALQASVDRQQHRQHDDNDKASVQGGGDAHAPMLVIILLAKLVAVVMEVVVVVVLGAVEAVDLLPNVCVVNVMILQPVHRDEDGLGKPKFTMPKFVGSTNVEEYLNWELKVAKLWRMHEYIEDKKIKLASSEFDDYALI